MYTPSVNDLLKPYQQYPRIIPRAILLVETNPRFLGLTRSMKAVVKALLTRASQHDGTQPIKARVDRVAVQADVSEKTVQRTLATIRNAGWIEQVTEGRSEWGVFTFRTYRLTEPMCKLLNLPARREFSQQTELSDGAVYVDLSFKKDQAEVSKEKRQGEPLDLPASLGEISALGIKNTGVAKLRGLASDAGHKLEDIFIVARESVAKAGATGGRLYRYLQAMIRKASDYAARARQIERHGAEPAPVRQTKLVAQKYAHKRFTAGCGTIVRIFDGIAEVTRDGAWIATLAGQQMAQVYADIESGRLASVL